MSEHTAEEIADVLDRAHDEMLVRGRCTHTFEDDEGHVCLFGAVRRAIFGAVVGLSTSGSKYLLYGQLATVMGASGFDEYFNDNPSTTDDDVLDAFRVVAKKLRNGEIVP